MVSTQETPNTWSIRRLIHWGADWLGQRSIESPRLDVELLLADTLSLTRMDLFLDLDRPLTNEELTAFKQRIRRRAQREPVAYIVGYRAFWKQRFFTTPAVLIPRPETETLIDTVLSHEKDRQRPLTLLDLGVGSGAILFSLLEEFPHATGLGIDLSLAAVEVAARNREALALTRRAQLLVGHWTAPLSPTAHFDLIVSNPPYVERHTLEQLQPEVKDQEPRLALDGGETGLACYQPLVPLIWQQIKPGGRVVLEIGYNQGKAVSHLLTEVGFKEVVVITDYGPHDRVVTGVKNI